MEILTEEHAFLLKAAPFNMWRLGKARVRKVLRGVDRTPEKVRVNYDKYRQAREIADFDEYVYGDPRLSEVILQDDIVQRAPVTCVRKAFLPRLREVIHGHIDGVSNPTIVEFGSGSGRNLLYLKKTFPNARMLGLELSPVSVDLSRRAASTFGLDVSFREADISSSIPDLPSDVTVCFSVHALEQMPRIFRAPVGTMLSLAERAVIFFEPVGELYAKNLRGWVARMRLAQEDYLDGLYNHLVEIRAPILRAERMRLGANPLNETVEIQVAGRASK